MSTQECFIDGSREFFNPTPKPGKTGNICIAISYRLIVDMLNTRAFGLRSVCFTTAFDRMYFFFVQRKRFRSLMRDFHWVTETLTEDGGLLTTGSESVILHTAARVYLIFKYFMLSFVSVPNAVNTFYYLNHLITGSSELANPIPFNANIVLFLYWIKPVYTLSSRTQGRSRPADSFCYDVSLESVFEEFKYVFQNNEKYQNISFNSSSSLSPQL